MKTDESGTEYPANYTCTKLSCVDNEFDKIDNNVPGLGMPRTRLFTIINVVAGLSAILGLAALVLNKP